MRRSSRVASATAAATIAMSSSSSKKRTGFSAVNDNVSSPSKRVKSKKKVSTKTTVTSIARNDDTQAAAIVSPHFEATHDAAGNDGNEVKEVEPTKGKVVKANSKSKGKQRKTSQKGKKKNKESIAGSPSDVRHHSITTVIDI
jgi:hypothetical protein